MPGQGRKLAAIMFTDIVGYSSIMQKDEDRGRLVRERHKQVFEHNTTRYQGEIIQYYGDGTLSAFQSAVAAVECAVKMQQDLRSYPQVPLRIGIHLGDIHYDETEVYGHGVNIAARLEPICAPGGIFISGKIYDEIRNHAWLKAASLGVYHFKNIEQPIEVFAVQDKGVAFPSQEEIMRIEARVKRMEMSDISQRSEAMQRFLRKERQRRVRRRWIRLVGAAAVLAALFLVVKLTGLDRLVTINPRTTSVAVLPFTNMSNTEENEYFSDGMTEDILTMLSRIEGLSVTSRTSVMQYKNTTKPIPQIASELGVDHILEGSVRREGDQVRINAQLIDAQSDRHIWAHTYNEQIVNIFDVQSQVANAIASQLRIYLSPAQRREMARRQASSSVAYDLYLQGREHYRRYVDADNDRAIALFKQALAIDDEYALAMAGLGDAYAQKSMFKGDTMLLDSSVYWGARAIAVDSSVSEGYKALGLAFHYKNKIEDAIVQYVKALELDPYNEMAAHNLSQIEMDRGDYVAAARWAAKNLEMSRTVPSSTERMAEIYIRLGDLETARSIVDEGLDINPESQELRLLKAAILSRHRQFAEARRIVEVVAQERPVWHKPYSMLGEMYLDQGEWGRAEEAFANALAQLSDTTMMTVILQTMHEVAAAQNATPDQRRAGLLSAIGKMAIVEKQDRGLGRWLYPMRSAIYAQLGDTRNAIEAMQNAVGVYYYDYPFIESSRLYQPVENAPGFRAVMRTMRERAEESLAAIRTMLESES